MHYFEMRSYLTPNNYGGALESKNVENYCPRYFSSINVGFYETPIRVVCKCLFNIYYYTLLSHLCNTINQVPSPNLKSEILASQKSKLPLTSMQPRFLPWYLHPSIMRRHQYLAKLHTSNYFYSQLF